MARDTNDKVTISYRIPESLRNRIAEAAERDGLNITQEISRCVEWYLSESDNKGIDSPLIRMQAQALKQCEQITGKHWFEDAETRARCRQTMIGVIDLLLPDNSNQLAALSPDFASLRNQLDAADIAMQDNKLNAEEAQLIMARIENLHDLIHTQVSSQSAAGSSRR